MMSNTAGVRLNIKTKKIIDVVGLGNSDLTTIDICQTNFFNMPRYVVVDGIPRFPLSYGFKRGDAWYLSRNPPQIEIEVSGFERAYGETSKRLESRIAPRKTKRQQPFAYNHMQQSKHSQVMGKTAKEYAQQLIEKRHLAVPSNWTENWCWCSMKIRGLSNGIQSIFSRNIVMTTEACYSQIEMFTAVCHRFADETRHPLVIEVFATVFPTTCLADKIRLRLWEPKSDTLFTEYVSARTTTFANALDADILFDNLMTEYKNNADRGN